MHKDSLEYLEESLKTQQYIAHFEMSAFNNRWATSRADIPLDFVDWTKILQSLAYYDPKHLGRWNEKLIPNDDLQKSLGVMGELMEPFCDFVNSSRKAAILQNLKILEDAAFVEVRLNSDGTEEYVSINIDEQEDRMKTFINSIMKARENFV